MFDTANQNRLSTGDRVDRADYYRTLLESERHGREQADKEIISLLHDVKNRYETKLNNYMAKKQNQKNKDKDKDTAEKHTKKVSPEKEIKKAQAADKAGDDWGTSTETVDKPTDGWGSPTQPADQLNDEWGTSAQLANQGDDDWGASDKPADDGNDDWGSSNQQAGSGNGAWGSSKQPKASDDWGSSTQPANNNDDRTASAVKDAPETNTTPSARGQAKQDSAQKNKKNKKNQKIQAQNGAGSTTQPPAKAADDWSSSAQAPADKNADEWGSTIPSAAKADDGWNTTSATSSNQQAKESTKDHVQKNQTNQPSTSVSTSTDDHEKKEDWIQQINYLQTQLDVSREESAKLKKRNLRLEKDLDHSKSLIRTLREGCSIVEDQARSFETRHDKIMSTKADLERELIAIKEESSRHITTINKLQKSNEQLSKAFIQSVQSHEACKKELDVLQQKYNRKLESYQIENLRLTEANSQLRKLVEYMQK